MEGLFFLPCFLHFSEVNRGKKPLRICFQATAAIFLKNEQMAAYSHSEIDVIASFSKMEIVKRAPSEINLSFYHKSKRCLSLSKGFFIFFLCAALQRFDRCAIIRMDNI